MKHLLFCLGATACASLSPISDGSSHSGSHTRVLAHLDSPQRGFPVRQGDPELPSANALAEWWRVTHDHLTAHVDLCVAPNGHTVDVRLAASSGERSYDEAVVRDAARWRYEPFTASAPVCEPATVTYLL
jgi:TonB family protein